MRELISAALAFFLGAVSIYGLFWAGFLSAPDNPRCNKHYEFLNPLLKCGEKPVLDKSSYFLFQNELSEKIAEMKKLGKVDEVSVFFRDLQNGPTINIDAERKFIPASLLKIPIMIAYFALAEDDRTLLDKVLAYKAGLEEEVKKYKQYVYPNEIIRPETPYGATELIRRMVVYSDNLAMHVLADYLINGYSPNENLITKTIQDFGLADPGTDIARAFVSVKSYSSFFRILYNSSYLSNEFSNLALKYLTENTHPGTLRRGVPADIKIAHKIGERSLDGEQQLHDCGIIYFPSNPYLLCVMTAGDDFQKLDETISVISGMIYEEVNSRKL